LPGGHLKREKEKDREFLSRQENGAYIAVDRLSPIHLVLPVPREAEERTNYLVILLTENFLHCPAVLRYCSTNAHPALFRGYYCASQLEMYVLVL